jgi:hypothetical protein
MTLPQPAAPASVRPPPRNGALVQAHLIQLSRGYELYMPPACEFVVVANVRLPPGYNAAITNVLVEMPYDYPLSPPGIGNNRTYIFPHLRYGSRLLQDVHPAIVPSYTTLGFGPWAWWCYRHIRWDPVRDNLIRFMEMFRADLSNPPVKQE